MQKTTPKKARRLGVLNDRDPDPHICIVQAISLIFKFVLVAVCLRVEENVLK